MSMFSTYAEISPSGTGIKLILLGKFTGRGRRRGPLEVYCRTRFFTVTGDRLPHSPSEPQPRQAELDTLMSEIFAEPKPRLSIACTPVSMADEEILDRASHAHNGELIAALWAGRWQVRYNSQSEADLALCSLLSFWCGRDAARVDTLFRRSGLCRPKWTERADYRTWTLAKATQGHLYDACRVA
jgi:primase-polymerase (primpol)-like protein